MPRKISRKSYERAKEIVRKYEAQEKAPTIKPITVNDVDFGTEMTSVRCLDESVIDEEFCSVLGWKLMDDYSGEYFSQGIVNLEGLGFLTIDHPYVLLSKITDQSKLNLVEAVNACLNPS